MTSTKMYPSSFCVTRSKMIASLTIPEYSNHLKRSECYRSGGAYSEPVLSVVLATAKSKDRGRGTTTDQNTERCQPAIRRTNHVTPGKLHAKVHLGIERGGGEGLVVLSRREGGKCNKNGSDKEFHTIKSKQCSHT